ncbi:MAG: tetratricopeptide repeat protein [Nitrospinota bacterium]|nr:tetratricopeptide repeat protein [Nitrospinota bacterium]
MTDKKKNNLPLIIVAALALVGAGAYGYMNLEQLEVMVKKTTGGEKSVDVLALAREAEQAGDSSKALKYYQTFLDDHSAAPANTDPGISVAYAGMGNIYYKQFKYPKAIEHFKKALDHANQYVGKQSQHAADNWLSLAAIYDKQGEVKLALEHYKNSRAIQAKLGTDTEKVDKVIDELEQFMVTANHQSSSAS